MFWTMDFKSLVLCLIGLSVAFSYDNISLKKMATQSHTYSNLLDDAKYGVDGNSATCMKTYDIGVHSLIAAVWWKVDLRRVYRIHSINILFKHYDGYEARQRSRLAGFSLYVSNIDVSSTVDIKSSSLCYKDGSQLPPLNFTSTCIMFGRYVIYYNERRREVTYPEKYELDNVFTELCEVIVNGCNESGVYGSDCDIQCPTHCKGNMCHIQNGTCYGCQPGWMGTTCNTKCREGWYGMNCSQQCVGHCRDNATCNHVTGGCDPGCDAAWTGYMCDKNCDNGTDDIDCINRCHCLNNYPCNKQTGNCEGVCNPGYTNSNCSKKCPPGYFGMGCSNTCSGHCIRNEPCDHVSGECSNGCQDGFEGTHCNSSCIVGYYGRNCSYVCPFTCQTCRHTDGMCTCKAGWTGPRCTKECPPGYFGIGCSNTCSGHCIRNEPCDHVSGECSNGCNDGYEGTHCNNCEIWSFYLDGLAF
ncbi:multiple epidermal growth factor-like domains protein 10 [Magallana gigas]|uniref:multiple epidermal growth factor-like domains protein 10 n=1 Tax=Magallana gigas TaxID=29159 RepID=UPI00333E94E1